MSLNERETPATVHHLAQGAVAAADPPPTTIPMPKTWKTRVLLPGAILGAAAALFLVVGAESLRPAVAVSVAPVVAQQVEGASGATTVQASGWLEPAPFPTYVSALVGGVVAEVLVLEGQTVKAGQVVARLIDERAKLAVRQAAAELARAQGALSAAEARAHAVKRANALLIDRKREVELRAAQVASARAQQAELLAQIRGQEQQVAVLQDEHTRAVKVLKTGVTTEGIVTRLGLRVQSASAMLDAMRRRRAVVAAGLAEALAQERAAQLHFKTLIEEERDAGVAAAEVQQAQAGVSRAQAQLDDARLALKRHEVRTQAPGVVMRRLVAPGSRVMIAGDMPTVSQVLHTYQPSRLQVRVDVPLADAAKVEVGQEALVDVESCRPDHPFQGVVVRVVHQADVQKNTVEFKVELKTFDEHLKPDMLARVRFLARAEATPGQGPERLFVPEAALVGREGQAATVWVASERRGARAEAAKRSVQLGTRRREGAVEVTGGLKLGDEVVVQPPADLSEGDLLEVRGEAP